VRAVTDYANKHDRLTTFAHLPAETLAKMFPGQRVAEMLEISARRALPVVLARCGFRRHAQRQCRSDLALHEPPAGSPHDAASAYSRDWRDDVGYDAGAH